MFKGLKKNVEDFKERTDNYFEEHPQVKKGLIVTGKVCAVAGVAFLGYKAIKSHAKANELQKQVNDMHVQRLCDALKESVVDSNPKAIDDHSFDMIFVDKENGTKFIAENGCLGSFVNDIMDGFDYKVEEAAKEVVQDAIQDVADNVTELAVE